MKRKKESTCFVVNFEYILAKVLERLQTGTGTYWLYSCCFSNSPPPALPLPAPCREDFVLGCL